MSVENNHPLSSKNRKLYKSSSKYNRRGLFLAGASAVSGVLNLGKKRLFVSQPAYESHNVNDARYYSAFLASTAFKFKDFILGNEAPKYVKKYDKSVSRALYNHELFDLNAQTIMYRPQNQEYLSYSVDDTGTITEELNLRSNNGRRLSLLREYNHGGRGGVSTKFREWDYDEKDYDEWAVTYDWDGVIDMDKGITFKSNQQRRPISDIKMMAVNEYLKNEVSFSADGFIPD